MVWNYQNDEFSLKKLSYCVIYYNFRHISVPYIDEWSSTPAHSRCHVPACDTLACGLRGVMRPWFGFCFRRYIYILFACLYRMLPHLSFFLHFFPTYLLAYWSFRLRIDSLRFQAGCFKKATKPGFSFSFLFRVVVHFFWLVNACFCCVRFSLFPYQVKRLAWGNVSEITYFVSSGT